MRLSVAVTTPNNPGFPDPAAGLRGSAVLRPPRPDAPNPESTAFRRHRTLSSSNISRPGAVAEHPHCKALILLNQSGDPLEGPSCRAHSTCPVLVAYSPRLLKAITGKCCSFKAVISLRQWRTAGANNRLTKKLKRKNWGIHCPQGR